MGHARVSIQRFSCSTPSLGWKRHQSSGTVPLAELFVNICAVSFFWQYLCPEVCVGVSMGVSACVWEIDEVYAREYVVVGIWVCLSGRGASVRALVNVCAIVCVFEWACVSVFVVLCMHDFVRLCVLWRKVSLWMHVCVSQYVCVSWDVWMIQGEGGVCVCTYALSFSLSSYETCVKSIHPFFLSWENKSC